MSEPVFTAGQRWVSNTESELGLGIVVEIANRRVEISFPASGERRTYAMANAPISRVRYEIGQQVSNEEGLQMTINDVVDNRGCLIYSGVDTEGEAVILPELDLNSFVQFSKPQDRLFAGQIDKNRAFELRCETLEHIRHQQQSSVRGLLGARVQLLPHQLYIASEAANRYSPRVLLADEVGLGKTIEAGLILHQQLITGRSKRVLVVVPDSLLHQWLVEMLRRFNLFFTILDEQHCLGLEEGGQGEDTDPWDDEPVSNASVEEDYNPFESAQLVLCTSSFLTKNAKRHTQALAADWDLLIVDEAHHLQWSESSSSPEYEAIETLSRKARGLLLLTATPEQLGVESHFARLRLLDPDRYFDLATFIAEEEKHQPVNELVQQLLSDDAFTQLQQQPSIVQQLRDLLGDEEIAELSALLNDEQSEDFPTVIATIIRNLLDRHGTGRVLFRNTRSSVTGFPDRHLHTYALPSSSMELQQDNAVNSLSSVEDLLRPELSMGDRWLEHDLRVNWLTALLKQHRTEKILVICAQATTALTLEEHLRLYEGLQSSVFHEGLSLVARDRAAAYFSDDEEGAQVLICSEIGSEGRNFQFAHHLVLFDLPLNPDLLEQRIGRLDRIGQRHSVDIHVPFYEHTAQQVLLRWYHEGVNAFERTCPAGLALFEHFREPLIASMENPHDEAALAQLITATQEKTQQTLETLQQGRDRLLELNSCNHEQADLIVESMLDEERRQELSNYMERVFDQFGVEQEHHSAASVILRPGDHMINHTFPALPDDGVTATFSREVALSREDMQFLSWEHPMVTGALDMVLSGDFGNTAFCTLKLPPLKPGTVILEAVFIVQCAAPAELQLQRYLPLTTLRVVVDSNNTHLTKVLTAERMNKLADRVAKRTAQDLINHARPQITAMITAAQSLAEQQKAELLAEAESSMLAEQSTELQRLQGLATVNPNIRQEEVRYLQSSHQLSKEYLQTAQLKLDALRVAVVTGK